MRKVAHAITAFLALAPGMANAAEPQCLTQSEFSMLVGYALPSVISAAEKRCTPTLAPDAFLSTSGSNLVARYATRKEASWPGAKAAFVKLSASRDDKASAIFRDMSDDTLREVLDTMLLGMVSQEIPLDDCGMIDKYLSLLAPLPPENTADLIGLTIGLVSKGKQNKVGKIAICEQ